MTTASPQGQPLVSIIVPIYNAEDYLPFCLDSILGQSYGNLQVLLVDDGSKDSSAQICDQYAAEDPRIEVIHQSNGGIGMAQNAGLDAARGQYIAFADNDDILDRRNIELLAVALQTTGADMSKARWRQFGLSQLTQVTQEAATGAPDPSSITVFENPLRAYQSVFCKSFRLLGDFLGRKTEARYFNEANWCRLYRAGVWQGVRFPEGMYAQDVMVAGRLYERMKKVADLDVNLYNWLQSPGSVTHAERGFGFHHDNFAAGAANFRLAHVHGITPMRSYYTMASALDAQAQLAAQDQGLAQAYGRDRRQAHELLASLGPVRRANCLLHRCVRSAEKRVYDRKIKNMS
ncbi:glycosyl transferase [Bifidobacterium aemilianum]|uniref:Glycosyl transferase n=1 Tax=Bifidobacterium aemilianum TaxID=2493120 RepID=A0A366K8B1_9BIFI|nr:glycosyltransferase [Bifidobacterium aemilianum]RBP97909.1 glycosyl transferase [Bifidobacterium aemilianum]